MRKFLALLLLASLAATPVLADDWRRHDIHDFHHHDFDHWRGGNWYNGVHEGRHGWWWIVDGGWYFYPQPVYPYPDPYTPPAVVMVPSPASPVVVEQPSYLYYCKNPAGYYPYVPQCFAHWRRVVASAAPATVVVQQPAPQPQYAPPQDERAVDEHQLEALAAEAQGIDPAAPGALTRLKAVSKKLEAFRESLSARSYNPMDVVKNADDLKRRIGVERKALAQGRPAARPFATTPAPMAAPAPEGMPQ